MKCRTRGKDRSRTSLPSDSSIKTAGVDPRFESLSKDINASSCVKPKLGKPTVLRHGVNHVSGLFCKASPSTLNPTAPRQTVCNSTFSSPERAVLLQFLHPARFVAQPAVTCVVTPARTAESWQSQRTRTLVPKGQRSAQNHRLKIHLSDKAGPNRPSRPPHWTKIVL